MVIGSSSVGMMAQTKKSVAYTENRQTLMRNVATGERQFSSNTFTKAYEQSAKAATSTKQLSGERQQEKANSRQGAEEAEKELGKEKDQSGIQNMSTYYATDRDRLSELVDQLRLFLINFRNRLKLLMGRRDSFFGSSNMMMDGTLDVSSGSGTYSLWKRTEYVSCKIEETEELSFSTTGKAITADGRTIEFDMELCMSREFVQETEALKQDVVAVMTDPLVINLNDSPISVSDQKWKFDIDGDGEKDNISMLGSGAGYLVLDKNGDGIINDGTEMFGARTGNGFSELAAYDEDGNGWIDENDSVFDKLSVWQKDAQGTDKLISLKNAKVGAIYLANVASEYALKSKHNNEQNAQIRRSGMYLTEDGKARSIQQLDMVKELISL